MLLQSLIAEREELKKQREEISQAFKQQDKDLSDQISEISVTIAGFSAGLDMEKINAGKQVVAVKGECINDKRKQLVQLAMLDIATGCEHLKNQYYGIKNYASFGDQIHNSRYYSAPQHGSIVFSIGLQRNLLPLEEPLSISQVEAALYYLHNLEAVTQAEKAGETA